MAFWALPLLAMIFGILLFAAVKRWGGVKLGSHPNENGPAPTKL